MNPAAIIGWIATTLTTVSMVPQAIQTMKTKSTAGISLWMYILFVVGVIFWIVAGSMMIVTTDLMTSLPIVAGNGITLIFSAITLFYKIRNVASGKETLSGKPKKADSSKVN